MFVRCLKKLAQGDIITSVWVDESHCIHRNGFNGTKFRTEFDSGYTALLHVIKLQKSKVNVCHCSATFPHGYQATITKLRVDVPHPLFVGAEWIAVRLDSL